MDTANQRTMEYKEKATHGTPDFPLGFYQVFPERTWAGIAHHWHEEIEILYFSQGKGTLVIDMQPYPVVPGVFYFVNSGELHSMTAKAPCRESAVLFHPRMLCFDTYDRSQSRLLQPLLKGELSLPRTLDSSSPAYEAFREEYLGMVQVCVQFKETIFTDVTPQLFLKAGLLKLLALLSSRRLLVSRGSSDSSKAQLVKTALAYIHAHYQEKIYVRDLAGQVNMNEQYFCRFFKDAIGQPPIAYLNQYRIRKAFSLLRDTDRSVMDVCLGCGFNNFGNFLREFRKYSGTTPNKYRNESSQQKS